MDAIANFLTSLMNGQCVGKKVVALPYSRLKFEIAKILEREHFLNKIEVVKGDAGKSGTLKVNLRYVEGVPAIQGTQRISKSGRRVYKKIFEVRHQLGDPRVIIMSTPKGVMTDREARKANVGGELICKVW